MAGNKNKFKITFDKATLKLQPWKKMFEKTLIFM